jgi:hypothetical protein
MKVTTLKRANKYTVKETAKRLYTWRCSYCGHLVHDCYDDPYTCPNCGE